MLVRANGVEGGGGVWWNHHAVKPLHHAVVRGVHGAGSEKFENHMYGGGYLILLFETEPRRTGTRTELNRKEASTHGSIHDYPYFVECFDVHKIYTRKWSYFVINENN